MKPASAKSCPSCGERYDTDVLFCPRDGTPLGSNRSPSFNGNERDSYLGVELAGQIRLKHLIGIGSMGRVYRAFQGGIDRDVAVKILHRELSGNTELVARFHREAKVASRLIHPNVVQVLMTGTVPFQADPHIGGELYLVMEHLDGISLLSALAAAGTGGGEGQALPLPRALHLVLQICDAVGEAHVQGIVHRDLKPENVMLVRRGDDPDYVKVLDFGIARLDWGDHAMATQAGLIFGTAKYISPEGAEGMPVTPAADVYSIATILYQCLAGRTPFEGDSPVALLVQHTHTPPAELRTIARASYVPAPIAAMIMQNLAKAPGERAPNARVFGRELVAAARASGLYPEDIATQATLFSPTSAVKLASRERTKSLELSQGFAARIGGLAAPTAESHGSEPPAEAPAGSRRPVAAEGSPGGPRSFPPVHTEIRELEAPPAEPPHRTLVDGGDLGAPLREPEGAHAVVPPGEATAGAPSRREPPASASARPAGGRASAAAAPSSSRGSKAPVPQLDFEDAGGRPGPDADGGPGGAPAASSTSTMQGTETSLELASGRRPRSRLARILVVAACALVGAPVLILGGRRLGGLGGPSSSDALEADLTEARECMRRHAWEAPIEHNLKEIVERDRVRYPDDPRVRELRREAAEALVSDALGRKYGSDTAGALHLARLALELDPDHPAAQHLIGDLQGAPPAVAPAVDAGVPERGPSRLPVRRGGRDPKDPRAAPSGAPSASAAPVVPPAPPASSEPSAVLPPPPPPLPVNHVPTPAPSSTGPWL